MGSCALKFNETLLNESEASFSVNEAAAAANAKVSEDKAAEDKAAEDKASEDKAEAPGTERVAISASTVAVATAGEEAVKVRKYSPVSKAAVTLGVSAVTAAHAVTTGKVIAIAKTIGTVIAAAAATFAITMGTVTVFANDRSNNEVTNVKATGVIVFTGEKGSEDPGKGYINPVGAVATSNSIFGALRVHHWEITTADGRELLYTAESDAVDQSVFVQMKENEMFGEFRLVFITEDANGTRYELVHNFFLLNQYLQD